MKQRYGERKAYMFKRCMAICAALPVMLAFFGCSEDKVERETTVSNTAVSNTDQSIIMPGDQYVCPVTEQTFYCMRVKDNYYKFDLTGTFADLLSADDPSLFPDLEDGQFACVTADIEETISTFGYYPIVTTVSTRIVDLKSYEPVKYKALTKVFDITDAGSKDINGNCNLFQYKHKGKLYLIFVYNGQVTAYSEDGCVADYVIKDGEDQFKGFYKVLH